MHPPLLNPNIPPALVFIAGALFIPLLRGKLKVIYMLSLPVLAFAILARTPNGTHWVFAMPDHKLTLGRVDRLSRPFGYAFILAAFIGIVYSMKVKGNIHHAASLVYAGSAVGVTFAGDFLSLYIFWEFMAVASTFLILARKTRESRKAAFRYVMVHIFGGLFLLGGIIVHVNAAKTLEFDFIGLSGLSSWMIFIGVAVNAAIFPLHSWLKDAYPEATPTGSVFLSAFTTKSAVYVMARMFPGTELLVWLGALTIVIPIFFAVIENDVRRVLAYSLINQVGFMLCGIGIGSELAVNGAVAHAFCHILYKALLFMSAGAVLEATGKIHCTNLGGLYKTMPLTALFCLVGTLSIAAFPLFSGFVSKTMILSAAGENQRVFLWFVLIFASACVFHYIKVPWFMFFSKDSGLRPKEAPPHMLVAMGMAAFFCLYIGINFHPLYNILPYAADYRPYTAAHVVSKMQLLMFGSFAFCLLMVKGVYPPEIKAINLDTDWFYRKGAALFYLITDMGLNRLNHLCDFIFVTTLTGAINRFAQNAPAKLAVMVLYPLSKLKGKEEHENMKRKIHATLETGTVPMGIGASIAVIFIVILFALK